MGDRPKPDDDEQDWPEPDYIQSLAEDESGFSKFLGYLALLAYFAVLGGFSWWFVSLFNFDVDPIVNRYPKAYGFVFGTIFGISIAGMFSKK